MAIHRAVPSLVIAVLVTVALASVAMTVVGLRRDPAPQTAPPSDPPTAAEPLPEVEAAAVLAAWDADRAAAWASGDVRRLRSLYVPGSVAGERDSARLRRWLDRGLVVEGLRTQVLSLREVDRSPDRWVLAVTDRIVGGVAAGNGTSTVLPNDTPSTRTVTLRLVGDRWVVASVRGLRASRHAR
jgi:hypothetical protein